MVNTPSKVAHADKLAESTIIDIMSLLDMDTDSQMIYNNTIDT
jgi:hypothetical protein